MLQEIIDLAVVTVLPFMEDRVTFQRPTVSTDTAGGHTQSPASTVPAGVPCVIDTATPNQRALLGDKVIKGTLYALLIPAQYGSVIVDLDSRCDAVVAARGVNGERTFHVQGIDRIAGAIVTVLASKEE